MFRNTIPLTLPFVLAGLAQLAATPLQAEVRAVLVGVSDYLTLDADLKGPAHDVALMAEVLAARGVAAPVVLGAPGGAVPTRQAILEAMDLVAGQSVPGDTVVFYFSGHGAQAPDLSGDEGGGFDEILLPADAAGWKGAIGAVENALLDDELQLWAQGLLDRGVKVIGILDACHSATGFRAAGGAGVPRGLDTAALGIPADAGGEENLPVSQPLTGDFAFLYSSQSDQRSFEYPIGDGAVWHGEFTLRLSQVLREAPEASWSQVLAAASDAMVQGPARQVPDGEGPLMTAPVFGAGQAPRRFAVTGGKIAAGVLDGWGAGDLVAVFATAAADTPLATLRLTDVSARQSAGGEPLPAGAMWAERIEAAPPPPLRLAAPVRADAADGLDYAPWIAALPPAIDGPADLVPILTGGRVALAGPDGILDPEGPGSTPRILPDPQETPADAVARVLEAAGHAIRLRSALAGQAGRALTGRSDLALTWEGSPAAPDVARDDACDPPGKATEVDPSAGVSPCDALWLTVRNTTGKTQDVSVLHIAADFTVTPLWPRRQLSNRLAPGESLRAGFQVAPGSLPATDEVLVLAVPVEGDAPRADLTVLATPETTRSAAGNGAAGWIGGLLGKADETMRGFALKRPALTMQRVAIRVRPDGPATNPARMGEQP